MASAWHTGHAIIGRAVIEIAQIWQNFKYTFCYKKIEPEILTTTKIIFLRTLVMFLIWLNIGSRIVKVPLLALTGRETSVIYSALERD